MYWVNKKVANQIIYIKVHNFHNKEIYSKLIILNKTKMKGHIKILIMTIHNQ